MWLGPKTGCNAISSSSGGGGGGGGGGSSGNCRELYFDQKGELNGKITRLKLNITQEYANNARNFEELRYKKCISLCRYHALPLRHICSSHAIRKVQEPTLELDTHGIQQVLSYADDVSLIGMLLNASKNIRLAAKTGKTKYMELGRQ